MTTSLGPMGCCEELCYDGMVSYAVWTGALRKFLLCRHCLLAHPLQTSFILALTLVFTLPATGASGSGPPLERRIEIARERLWRRAEWWNSPTHIQAPWEFEPGALATTARFWKSYSSRSRHEDPQIQVESRYLPEQGVIVLSAQGTVLIESRSFCVPPGVVDPGVRYWRDLARGAQYYRPTDIYLPASVFAADLVSDLSGLPERALRGARWQLSDFVVDESDIASDVSLIYELADPPLQFRRRARVLQATVSLDGWHPGQREVCFRSFDASIQLPASAHFWKTDEQRSVGSRVDASP